MPPEVVENPFPFRSALWTLAYSYFFWFEMFCIMLLVLLTGPNLISRDLRFNALPLYLSRPLTRLDYFIGKLGVIGTLVAALAILPALAAYLLGVCFSLDLTVVRDTWRLLPAILLFGLLIVVSAGTLMLALSSLSRRSLYVGIAWAGLWLIGWTLATVLDGIQQVSIRRDIWEKGPRVAVFHPSGKDRPQTPEEWKRFREQQVRLINQKEPEIDKALAEAARSDWRPLCSYTANLERLGEELLQTDAAWVVIGRSIEKAKAVPKSLIPGLPLLGFKPPEPINERRWADKKVPQYPWIWSAGVLAGLLGLSLWTLNTRVKSLDRLK
jgi:ABC-2 type transport system permease protein